MPTSPPIGNFDAQFVYKIVVEETWNLLNSWKSYKVNLVIDTSCFDVQIRSCILFSLDKRQSLPAKELWALHAPSDVVAYDAEIQWVFGPFVACIRR